MTILKNLSNRYSIDSYDLPATDGEIELLKTEASIEVPKEYIEIIKVCTELEICVDKEMYIRIWGPLGCIEFNEAYYIQKYIHKSLAIGDNEGCGALMYLYGNEGFGIYLCRFDNLDIDDAVKVASNLEELLIHNIGIDVLKLNS